MTGHEFFLYQYKDFNENMVKSINFVLWNFYIFQISGPN